MYWADTWEASVWRMRYDGSHAQRVSAGRLAAAALHVHRGHLYWLDA